jgi:tetratricopeptide (TPR) repeat protein
MTISPDNYIFDLNIKDYERFDMLTFSSNNDTVLYWLKTGLIWYYAFNHEEAIECFNRALLIDENCAMAHWGISISHGPNYNSEYMMRDCFPSGIEAYDHAKKAMDIASNEMYRSSISDLEYALIEALSIRYKPVSDVDDGKPIYQNTQQYADAFANVYERYPNITCVACLYAEALMNFAPWRLWNLDAGEPLGSTPLAKSILERALSAAPYHIGLNHFYIHLMEMSPTPELALHSCTVLKSICPDAGHLTHMPSHIHVLLGQWGNATEYNTLANIADRKYAEYAGIQNCYTGYRLHNIHFIAYAAMFAGIILLLYISININ